LGRRGCRTRYDLGSTSRDTHLAREGKLTPKKPGTPNPKKVQEILKAFDGQRWVSTYRGERLVGQPPFREGFEFLSRQVFADNLTTLAEYLSAGKAK
jgi:hypothetical protein